MECLPLVAPGMEPGSAVVSCPGLLLYDTNLQSTSAFCQSVVEFC